MHTRQLVKEAQFPKHYLRLHEQSTHKILALKEGVVSAQIRPKAQSDPHIICPLFWHLMADASVWSPDHKFMPPEAKGNRPPAPEARISVTLT